MIDVIILKLVGMPTSHIYFLISTFYMHTSSTSLAPLTFTFVKGSVMQVPGFRL